MLAPRHLETERLRLRPVVLGDAAAIFDYAGAERPTHFMNFRRHGSLADSEAFARWCVHAWAQGSDFPWAITTKESDVMMGVIELRLTPPRADFGYILGEAWWGRGYASEAARAVVGWAMSRDEIFRVWATCHPDNQASAAVLRKAGLSHEGTFARWEARPQLGEPAGDSHCYAVTRSPPDER